MSVNVGKAVGYLDLDTTGFSKGFSSALKDLQAFKDQSATMSSKVNALGSAMTSVGGSMTKYVTTPIVGAGSAMVLTAAKFESAMSEVAAISGATGEDLEALTDKAKEMGATTKFSASESAEALKYMAMAGWDTQKMLDGLPGIMNLAAASGEDLGTVSDIVTDAMTAFGLSADQAAHFSDVLAQASNRSNTNVAMLGESFKYVAPVAGALGFSIEDTAVALGLMANSGIKASQAGTSLRSLFTNLTHPVGQAEDAIEALNISMTDTDGNVKSLSQLMLELREKFASLTDAEKAQYAAMLAGQEGMSGLLAIVNTSDADFNALTEAINNANGAAQTMSDTMLDNLSGQLTILKSTIEGIAISFGDIMLPAVKDVVSGLQSFATWLNNLTDSQKEMIVRVAEFVAVLGPLLLIGGKFVKGIGTLIKGFEQAKTTFMALKTFLVTASAPISTVILVIAGVVAAIVALKLAWDNNFGGIQEKTAEVWGYIQTIFTQIAAFLGLFWEGIKSLWDSDFMYIKTFTQQILNDIEMIFSGALDIITGVFQVFASLLSGDWEGLWEGVQSIFKGIIDIITGLWGAFLDIMIELILGIGGTLYNAAVTVFTSLKNGFMNMWTNIYNWFVEAAKDPEKTINNIKDSLYNAGKNAINAIWDGMKFVWDSLVGWFEDAANWIADKLSFWQSSVDQVNAGRSAYSHAAGLDYVPYDGYPAILHEGERVLTKQENRQGAAYNTKGMTIVVPLSIDGVEFARAEAKYIDEELSR